MNISTRLLCINYGKLPMLLNTNIVIVNTIKVIGTKYHYSNIYTRPGLLSDNGHMEHHDMYMGDIELR